MPAVTVKGGYNSTMDSKACPTKDDIIAPIDAINEKDGFEGHDGRTFEYCPYTETSKSYNQTRAPLGLNVFLGSACISPWHLKEQSLLDIGCGTGTFLNAVKGNMGDITGMDYNEGMLSEAKSLLGDSTKLLLGSADELPFDTESFHCATFNQVIHHFPKDDEYRFLARALMEAFRVLKPGGILWINTSMPEQQRDGFWWLALFPNASKMICSRFPPMSILKEHLKAAGFLLDADSVMVPLERSLMAEHKYLEKGVEAAFDPAYRAGDSSWSMAENSGELEEGLSKLRSMIDAGSADEWLNKREQLRLSVGQATFITAKKPSA
jgi:ubiquinone/menaquinone biosynthesis C-methylase UbiE